MVVRAHYDGRVLVPDQPLDLEPGHSVTIEVLPAESSADYPLMRLAAALDGLPDDPDAPVDGAVNHDHYLYGLPKNA